MQKATCFRQKHLRRHDLIGKLWYANKLRRTDQAFQLQVTKKLWNWWLSVHCSQCVCGNHQITKFHGILRCHVICFLLQATVIISVSLLMWKLWKFSLRLFWQKFREIVCEFVAFPHCAFLPNCDHFCCKISVKQNFTPNWFDKKKCMSKIPSNQLFC